MNPRRKTLAFLLLFFAVLVAAPLSAQVSPFMGLGNAQFFDNNGKPLTAGMLYSFQAGTSTQQATYTDSTGAILNPNPIPFGSGARVSIWLLSGAFYKFVLCSQNDGPFCAPADVLFSVDQVPGSPASSGTATAPFISNSANPATTGILRLATGDAICWRNAAGTANLCITKDSSDVLAWAGGAIKFPEIPCSNSGLGFDYLCASSTNHRWMMANNAGTQQQIVAAGVDINTSDQVTQVHFGATPVPFSSTAPSAATPTPCWNGTALAWCSAVEQVFGWGAWNATLFNGTVNCSAYLTNPVVGYCAATTLANSHTISRFTWVLFGSPSGCATSPVIGVIDLTSSTNLYTVTISNGMTVGYHDSGALSIATTAGHVIVVGLVTSLSGCTGGGQIGNLEIVYQ